MLVSMQGAHSTGELHATLNETLKAIGNRKLAPAARIVLAILIAIHHLEPDDAEITTDLASLGTMCGLPPSKVKLALQQLGKAGHLCAIQPKAPKSEPVNVCLINPE